MSLRDRLNNRLHIVETPTGGAAPRQYYDANGWVGGQIPVPAEFKKQDGSLKDYLGQLDSIIGPQYDYPKGSKLRGSGAPAPGWADINPREVLSSGEIANEMSLAKRQGIPSTPAKLREAARISQIIRAIERHVSSVVKPLRNQYPQYSLEDMISGGMHGAIKALRSQLDQGRDGNKFLTWLTPHIVAGANHGVGGGAEHRRARGDIGRLLKARTPAQVNAVISVVAPENQQGHDFSARTTDANPWGRFTPRIWKAAEGLRQALEPNSEEDPQTYRHELQQLDDEVREDEEGTVGAKTGFMKGVVIPHSGKEQWQSFVKDVGFKTTHVQGPEGGEVERPGLSQGRSKMSDERVNAADVQWPNLHDASPDTVASFTAALEFAVAQYLDKGSATEFTIAPTLQKRLQRDLGKTVSSIPYLDLQQIRWVVRRLGLREYPTKNKTFDLEFDNKKFKAALAELTAKGADPAAARKQAKLAASSQWVRLGCPVMDIAYEPEAAKTLDQGGMQPEVPSLRDACPTPVDPQTWAGAGGESSISDLYPSSKKAKKTDPQPLQTMDQCMTTFGYWYWVFTKYEVKESTDRADLAIIQEGWHRLRAAMLEHYARFTAGSDWDLIDVIIND